MLDFLGQPGNPRVVDIERQLGVFTGAQAGDFILLAVDITGVLGLDLDLLGHLRVLRTTTGDGYQPGVIDFRAGQQVEQVVFVGQRRAEVGGNRIALRRTRAYPGAFQALFFQSNGFALGFERGPTYIIDQTQLAAFLG